AFAYHVKLPLECVFIGERTTSYKDLLDVRLRTSRHAANGGSEARRVPPPQYRQSFLAHDALQNSFALQPLMSLHRQERHAYAISPGQRQFEAQLATLPHKELMWDLEQNAGAIARLRIASAGSAVRQVEQHLDSLAYDFVTLVAANMGHESDPARIVLLRRMVEALSGGRAIRIFQTRRHGHVYSIGLLCRIALPDSLLHRLRAGLRRPWRLAASRSVARELGLCPQRPREGRTLRLSNTLRRFLLTARWVRKYNSEFRWEGCKF